MVTKLFIGKLSFDTTDETLNAEFAKYGTVVNAVIIKERDTNQSKGFGFVEMDSEEAAQAAIDALDGKDFEGRTIVVSIARPREDRPQGGGGFNSGFQRR